MGARRSRAFIGSPRQRVGGAHEALRHRHHDERRAHQHDAGCRRGGPVEQRCDGRARARRASARAGRRAAAAPRTRWRCTRTRRRGRASRAARSRAAASASGSRRASRRLRRTRGTPRAARSTAAARGAVWIRPSSTPCSRYSSCSGRPITPPASSAVEQPGRAEHHEPAIALQQQVHEQRQQHAREQQPAREPRFGPRHRERHRDRQQHRAHHALEREAQREPQRRREVRVREVEVVLQREGPPFVAGHADAHAQ